MSNPPRLTDRTTLTRHRDRAQAAALFLHEAVRADAEDRLAMVNRRFTDTTIVTPFPEIWQAAFPTARFIPDTEVLDLREGDSDLVIHGLCLHWADDPLGQLIQSRRALRPDGLCLALTLGGQTLHQLRAALAQAETELTGGISPRVAPMAEIRDLGALLQRAGFALPVADATSLTASYATPLHLMQELRAMGENNALAARLRRPTRRSVLLRACEIYTQAFGQNDGRVPATFEIITLTGWAPDASQPQPLRPGSASQRLADALGTSETPLNN